MISWDNYEEYMMLHADGELQPHEVQELVAFVNAHPALKSEMAAYERTKIAPDEMITYGDKNLLLKPAPVKRTIVLSNWKRYAIAAGIAAIICAAAFKYNEASKVDCSIAQNHDTQKVAQQQKHALPVQQEDTTTSKNAFTLTPTLNKNTNPHHPQKTQTVIRRHSTIKPTIDPSVEETATVIRKAPIAPLAVAGTHPLPCPTPVKAIDLVPVPAYKITTTTKEPKHSLQNKLPLDEANRRQLKTLSRMASGVFHGISSARKKVDGNEITFNIKDNNVHISF